MFQSTLGRPNPQDSESLVASQTEYGATEQSDEPQGEEVHEENSHMEDLFGSLQVDREKGSLGLDFQFQNLDYKVHGTSRPILQAVSGQVRKGSMFGIMGPSGAGKSTLLNILGARIQQSAGLLSINGIQNDLRRFSQLIGFVPQDDIAFPDLTVRENILHTACIRLAGSMSTKAINAHVDSLIAYLGLSQVSQQRVGSAEERGISGGERKRVCVAREIVAMPMAVLLDEPTSGLDATNALSIVIMLKRLSALGITVICSIHQPRIDIFDLLDDVLLMVSGEVTYLGAPSRIQEHFEPMGFSFASNQNPADVVMDIVARQKKSPSNWNSRPDSPSKGVPKKECHSLRCESFVEPEVALDETQPPLPWSQMVSWPVQVLRYIYCGVLQQNGRPFGIILEMATAAICGTLIGLSVYERKGHLFQGYFQPPFTPLSSALDYYIVLLTGLLASLAISLAGAPAGIKTIAEEKTIFYHEVSSGHSASAYFIGKDIATWPRMLAASLHFTAFLNVLAASIIPMSTLFALNAVYFFCIYGLASLAASFVRRQDALLLAMLISLVVGVLNGFGVRVLCALLPGKELTDYV
ncbi:uncharacterized protein N7459_006986 [Penicillium hispanicum]|uniref:uncharacterized protein n=1 Tax=Penicillium hispanicum TaxID=1080232 RepID=UPI0025423F90|nr:uncharacterized protein N7459_006986 [Penicillium hispanicum]KAJ5578022.1 hypothetical protein N7459_006986 [Penicillium hispanicum]